MTVRTFAPLIIAALGAHLLDAIITAVGIGRGIPEDNPVQLVAFHAAGLAGMDALKLFAVAAVLGLCWRGRKRYPSWFLTVMLLCVGVPALVVSVLNAVTIMGG